MSDLLRSDRPVMRTIAVWCPDWPVAAAVRETKIDMSAPVAVLHGNRVVACSHTARAGGVRRGQRRREAQGRCPSLAVLPRNEAAEARAFEPVVLALESIAPGVEITRPGLAAIGARGPSRYFGGETGVLRALASSLHEALAPQTPDVLIGVADGAFAAEQAARRGVIVPAGQAAAFLADLPIETLDEPDLVDLLRRLGIRTLGAFAALDARDVQARFGPSGAWVHRQAGGRDDRPVAARRPPAELAVELALEPALDRVDAIAFSARESAERFVGGLAAYGLACTCFELEVITENGEEAVRQWRHTGVLSAVDVLDRIRWQLTGWLSSGGPSAGVVKLRLVPVETVPTGVHQQALWGGAGDGDERAARALARVQTLLGHGSVLRPVLSGGRDPSSRTTLVPWGDDAVPVHSPEQPWPGALPAPAPSVLLDPPRPARVLDANGAPVIVTERGGVPRPPAYFALGSGGERPMAITAWAGPWPVDERWWSDSARRVVRCQVVDVRGRAYLVLGEDGRWVVEAIYD